MLVWGKIDISTLDTSDIKKHNEQVIQLCKEKIDNLIAGREIETTTNALPAPLIIPWWKQEQELDVWPCRWYGIIEDNVLHIGVEIVRLERVEKQ